MFKIIEINYKTLMKHCCVLIFKPNIVIKLLLTHFIVFATCASHLEELPLDIKHKIFQWLPRQDLAWLAHISEPLRQDILLFFGDKTYWLRDENISIKDFNSVFHNKSLTEKVRISYFSLKAEQMKIVGTTTNITHLDFTPSHIDKKCLEIFFKNLLTNKSIVHLDLSNIQMNGKDVGNLCKSLIKNDTVKRLELSGYEIRDEGAQHLA